MMTDQPAFVPVLTVMVDYGGAPFLWLKESPDEPVDWPLEDPDTSPLLT